MTDLIQIDPWDTLRAHTPARIALGRAGNSLPTRAVLKFGLAHAQARDAVLRPLDYATLQAQIVEAGFHALRAQSNAPDRQTYLLRPDKGRQLTHASDQCLRQHPPTPDLAIVIADGLSSIAVQRHALPLLTALRDVFSTDWAHIPVVIAEQARVALGDDVGNALQANLVLVLIGERPGLTAPDSLGIYLTWQPQRGRMDSERNCISNVRPEGLGYSEAAHKLAYLLRESMRLQLSGVELKDESGFQPALNAG